MNRTRPNILLITADQWRGDHLGALHHPVVQTPHLDALAQEGTLFARHFSQAYPCGPARASLVTGLYPHKHRSIANGVPLDRRHPTLFTELRAAGYRPTLFGYTDTTLDPRGKPYGDPDNGDYENVCPGIVADTLMTERAAPWLAFLHANGYTVKHPDAGRDGILRERAFDEPALFSAEHSESHFLTDRFLGWLAVAGSAPFCAHLSFFSPHPPFTAPAPYHAAYRARATDGTMPPPIGAMPRGDVDRPYFSATDIDAHSAQHPLLPALYARMKAGNFAEGLTGLSLAQTAATIDHVRAVYAAQISEVDHQIGRVMAALRASGRWHDTIVIFTADHGEQLFDHGMLGKVGYFDQAAHIPLIVRDPRRVADPGRGKIVSQFTETVDVLPTVLDAAGTDIPANADGHSLLSLCAGNVPAFWRDEAHWSYDFRNIRTHHMERKLNLPSDWCNLQVVRTDTLKYVHFAGLPPVLFDLKNDPDEWHNVADDPAHQALRLEGLERMMTWRQRHEDRALTGYLAHAGTLYRDRIDDPPDWPAHRSH